MKIARLSTVVLILLSLNKSVKAQDREMVLFAKDAISTYLTERPDAADTVEGIHNWWINWPCQQESIIVTETALTQLESESIVESVSAGDRVLWRKKP